MKDYKLSQIKKICLKHKACNKKCPFHSDKKDYSCEFLRLFPNEWVIEKEEPNLDDLLEQGAIDFVQGGGIE